jgi:hypothetical protein
MADDGGTSTEATASTPAPAAAAPQWPSSQSLPACRTSSTTRSWSGYARGCGARVDLALLGELRLGAARPSSTAPLPEASRETCARSPTAMRVESDVQDLKAP